MRLMNLIDIIFETVPCKPPQKSNLLCRVLGGLLFYFLLVVAVVFVLLLLIPAMIQEIWKED